MGAQMGTSSTGSSNYAQPLQSTQSQSLSISRKSIQQIIKRLCERQPIQLAQSQLDIKEKKVDNYNVY